MPSLPEEQAGKPEERGCWLSGRPRDREAGAGCAQWQVTQCLRDLWEELAAGMGMSLEICWKSLHDLGILSLTSLVC